MSTATETMTNLDAIPPVMTLTDNAAEKIKSLIEEEGSDALKLRVFVTGGGCSGFQYGFTFDENMNEGDTEVQQFGEMARRLLSRLRRSTKAAG